MKLLKLTATGFLVLLAAQAIQNTINIINPPPPVWEKSVLAKDIDSVRARDKIRATRIADIGDEVLRLTKYGSHPSEAEYLYLEKLSKETDKLVNELGT
jgi:hypothetical protein